MPIGTFLDSRQWAGKWQPGYKFSVLFSAASTVTGDTSDSDVDPGVPIEVIDIAQPTVNQDQFVEGGWTYATPTIVSISAFSLTLFDDVDQTAMRWLVKWRGSIIKNGRLYAYRSKIIRNCTITLYDKQNRPRSTYEYTGVFPLPEQPRTFHVSGSERTLVVVGMSCDDCKFSIVKPTDTTNNDAPPPSDNPVAAPTLPVQRYTLPNIPLRRADGTVEPG